MRFAYSLLSLLLVSCAAAPESDTPLPLVLQKSSFETLPAWDREDFDMVHEAFKKSCAPLLKKEPEKYLLDDKKWGKVSDWQVVCKKLEHEESEGGRSFFEENFNVYSILSGTEEEGLFTGYYESALNGSLTRSDIYKFPLHSRPEDLVMVNLGEFREELKGQRIAGRVVGGNLKPYETREEIVAGKLPDDQEKILVWLDDPVDAFFVQVQGSGAVRLDDGSTMRIGYDGQNGHVYYAIGKELIARGALDKDNVSMQTIRSWLETNPEQANEIMNTNKSYVFFKVLDGEGPIGGQGVALTPLRSLAVDHAQIPYGVPLWLDAESPDKTGPRIQRLMIAQDTGGAIKGAVRGDVFWGFGENAESQAGIMKSKGRYWALIPKTADYSSQ